MPTWYLAGNERYRGPVFSAAASAGFLGLGDIVGGALFYGGLRAYTSAWAAGSHNAIQVADSGTNVTTDIALLPTGYADFATLNTRIGSDANLYLTKIYDQSGNNNHLNFAVGQANAPHFKLSGPGGFTSWYFPDITSREGNSTINITQSQPFVMITVGLGEVGGNTRIAFGGATIGLNLTSITADNTNSLNASPPPSTATWYAFLGLYNDTSSAINLNGAEGVTGTTPGTTGFAGDSLSIGLTPSGQSNLVRGMEFGLWPAGTNFDNSTKRNLFITNMRSATSGWNF